ncbi:hypothetical protein ONZ45_g18775 [Pleurotus djamor]|nr:hypothetical protein ONZ45_g18775 [Pleurotus djamor]
MVSDSLQRLAAQTRKLRTSKIRTISRKKPQRTGLKLTAADKKLRQEKRHQRRDAYKSALGEINDLIDTKAQELHETFGGHSVAHYKLEILQTARSSGSGRDPTRWNAYVRKRVGELQLKKPEIPQAMKQFSEEWRTMSAEERLNATDDALKDLSEHREMKLLAPHNVPISAFHDTRANLETITHDLAALHSRTGCEAFLTVVRSSSDHYNEPFVFYTSPRVADFINLAYKHTGADFALRLEGYCISGVSGYVQNQIEANQQLKKETAALIMDKLRKAAGAEVKRMNYANFEDSITAKYGVVVEGWPLPKFCSPGDLSSRLELQTLYQAWESGRTRFRKLSNQEHVDWEMQHVQRRQTRGLGGTEHPQSLEFINGPPVQAFSGAQIVHPPTHLDPQVPASLSLFDLAPTYPPDLGAPLEMSFTDLLTSDRDLPIFPHEPFLPQPMQLASTSTTGERAAPQQLEFINHAVTTTANTPIFQTVKSRKPRSDKGKKRGPRGRENVAPTGVLP